MKPFPPSLALAVVALAGMAACSSEPPTATRTVQLSVVAGAEHGGRPFHVPMTQEVTSLPTPQVGDPDGTGLATITVNVGQREVCWELTVSNIALPAIGAHIHRAAPGARGGIVVWLSSPDQTGTARGCAGDLSRDLLKEILQTPEAFYVNVHTTQFPIGAIRGQLAK